MPSGRRARRGGSNNDFSPRRSETASVTTHDDALGNPSRRQKVQTLDTHPLGRLDPEPVFPPGCVPRVAGQPRGIAVLDVAPEDARLVGLEGREFGSDEDGLLFEGRAQPGIVRCSRARPQSEQKGNTVVQAAGRVLVHRVKQRDTHLWAVGFRLRLSTRRRRPRQFDPAKLSALPVVSARSGPASPLAGQRCYVELENAMLVSSPVDSACPLIARTSQL
ncbi:hypothetical protein L209DRAFT_306620 [Thermothelomyces heterothallicus CBS 203.75]